MKQTKQNKIFWLRNHASLKGTAVFTLAVFLSSTIAWSAPPVAVTPENISSVPSTSDIHIPEEFGVVEEVYQAPNSTGNSPMVIYIQDAHCIYEAQTNIRKIIDKIQKDNDLKLVAIEGGEGKIDPTLYRAFPIQDVKEKVIDRYVQRGELSGADYAAIVNEKESDFYGIEDVKLYDENKAAFLKAIDEKKRVDMKLDDIDRSLRKMKENIYSLELKDLFAKTEDYEKEQLNLLDYVKYLKGLGAVEGSYPMIDDLLAAVEREQSMDPKKVDEEAALLENEIERVLKSSNKEDFRDFQKKFTAFRRGEVKRESFIPWLMSKAKDAGVLDEAKYPALSDYLHHIGEMEKIKGEPLFKEIDQLTQAVKEKLFKNDQQRKLDQMFHNLKILRDLSKLELTRDELAEYREHPENFSEKIFWDFIGRVPGPMELDDLFESHRGFYEAALKRDQALHQNLMKLLNDQNRKFAMVITGGFHSNGIKEMLKRDGISYMLIVPRITQFSDKSPYWDVMQGKVSYARFMKKQTLAPWDAMGNDAAKKGISNDFIETAAKGNEEEVQKITSQWRVAANKYAAFISGLFTRAKASVKDTIQEYKDSLQSFIDRVKAAVNSKIDAVEKSDADIPESRDQLEKYFKEQGFDISLPAAPEEAKVPVGAKSLGAVEVVDAVMETFKETQPEIITTLKLNNEAVKASVAKKIDSGMSVIDALDESWKENIKTFFNRTQSKEYKDAVTKFNDRYFTTKIDELRMKYGGTLDLDKVPNAIRVIGRDKINYLELLALVDRLAEKGIPRSDLIKFAQNANVTSMAVLSPYGLNSPRKMMDFFTFRKEISFFDGDVFTPDGSKDALTAIAQILPEGPGKQMPAKAAEKPAVPARTLESPGVQEKITALRGKVLAALSSGQGAAGANIKEANRLINNAEILFYRDPRISDLINFTRIYQEYLNVLQSGKLTEKYDALLSAESDFKATTASLRRNQDLSTLNLRLGDLRRRAVDSIRSLPVPFTTRNASLINVGDVVASLSRSFTVQGLTSGDVDSYVQTQVSVGKAYIQTPEKKAHSDVIDPKIRKILDQQLEITGQRSEQLEALLSFTSNSMAAQGASLGAQTMARDPIALKLATLKVADIQYLANIIQNMEGLDRIDALSKAAEDFSFPEIEKPGFPEFQQSILNMAQTWAEEAKQDALTITEPARGPTAIAVALKHSDRIDELMQLLPLFESNTDLFIKMNAEIKSVIAFLETYNNQVVAKDLTDNGTISQSVFEKAINYLFESARSMPSQNISPKIDLSLVTLPMARANELGGLKMGNRLKQRMMEEVKKLVAKNEQDEKKFPAQLRIQEMEGSSQAFSGTRLVILGMSSDQISELLSTSFKNVKADLKNEFDLTDQQVESLNVYAGHTEIGSEEIRTNIRKIEEIKDSEEKSNAFRHANRELEKEIVQKLKEVTAKAQVQETMYQISGVFDDAQLNKPPPRGKTRLDLRLALMDAENKYVPQNDADNGFLPRPSHDIGRVNIGLKNTAKLLDQAVELIKNNNLRGLTDALKKTQEEYSRTKGFLDLLTIKSLKDIRYPRSYKLAAIRKVVAADENGSLQALLDRMKQYEKSSFFKSGERKEFGAAIDNTRKGFYMTKQGDEIGLIYRINGKLKLANFSELNKFNAMNSLYSPDPRDSLYHNILNSFHKLAENYDFESKDGINREEHQDFLERINDAILDTEVTFDHDISLQSGDGKPIVVAIKRDGRMIASSEIKAGDIAVVRDLMFQYSEKLKEGGRERVYLNTKNNQQYTLNNFQNLNAENKANLKPVIGSTGSTQTSDSVTDLIDENGEVIDIKAHFEEMGRINGIQKKIKEFRPLVLEVSDISKYYQARAAVTKLKADAVKALKVSASENRKKINSLLESGKVFSQSSVQQFKDLVAAKNYQALRDTVAPLLQTVPQETRERKFMDFMHAVQNEIVMEQLLKTITAMRMNDLIATTPEGLLDEDLTSDEIATLFNFDIVNQVNRNFSDNRARVEQALSGIVPSSAIQSFYPPVEVQRGLFKTQVVDVKNIISQIESAEKEDAKKLEIAKKSPEVALVQAQVKREITKIAPQIVHEGKPATAAQAADNASAALDEELSESGISAEYRALVLQLSLPGANPKRADPQAVKALRSNTSLWSGFFALISNLLNALISAYSRITDQIKNRKDAEFALKTALPAVLADEIGKGFSSLAIKSHINFLQGKPTGKMENDDISFLMNEMGVTNSTDQIQILNEALKKGGYTTTLALQMVRDMAVGRDLDEITFEDLKQYRQNYKLNDVKKDKRLFEYFARENIRGNDRQDVLSRAITEIGLRGIPGGKQIKEAREAVITGASLGAVKLENNSIRDFIPAEINAIYLGAPEQNATRIDSIRVNPAGELEFKINLREGGSSAVKIKPGQKVLLGRNSGIKDSKVSGEHLKLSFDGQKIEIENLEPRNGTFVSINQAKTQNYISSNLARLSAKISSEIFPADFASSDEKVMEMSLVTSPNRAFRFAGPDPAIDVNEDSFDFSVKVKSDGTFEIISGPKDILGIKGTFDLKAIQAPAKVAMPTVVKSKPTAQSLESILSQVVKPGMEASARTQIINMDKNMLDKYRAEALQMAMTQDRGALAAELTQSRQREQIAFEKGYAGDHLGLSKLELAAKIQSQMAAMIDREKLNAFRQSQAVRGASLGARENIKMAVLSLALLLPAGHIPQNSIENSPAAVSATNAGKPLTTAQLADRSTWTESEFNDLNKFSGAIGSDIAAQYFSLEDFQREKLSPDQMRILQNAIDLAMKTDPQEMGKLLSAAKHFIAVDTAKEAQAFAFPRVGAFGINLRHLAELEKEGDQKKLNDWVLSLAHELQHLQNAQDSGFQAKYQAMRTQLGIEEGKYDFRLQAMDEEIAYQTTADWMRKLGGYSAEEIAIQQWIADHIKDGNYSGPVARFVSMQPNPATGELYAPADILPEQFKPQVQQFSARDAMSQILQQRGINVDVDVSKIEMVQPEEMSNYGLEGIGFKYPVTVEGQDPFTLVIDTTGKFSIVTGRSLGSLEQQFELLRGDEIKNILAVYKKGDASKIAAWFSAEIKASTNGLLTDDRREKIETLFRYLSAKLGKGQVNEGIISDLHITEQFGKSYENDAGAEERVIYDIFADVAGEHILLGEWDTEIQDIGYSNRFDLQGVKGKKANLEVLIDNFIDAHVSGKPIAGIEAALPAAPAAPVVSKQPVFNLGKTQESHVYGRITRELAGYGITVGDSVDGNLVKVQMDISGGPSIRGLTDKSKFDALVQNLNRYENRGNWPLVGKMYQKSFRDEFQRFAETQVQVPISGASLGAGVAELEGVSVVSGLDLNNLNTALFDQQEASMLDNIAKMRALSPGAEERKGLMKQIADIAAIPVRGSPYSIGRGYSDDSVKTLMEGADEEILGFAKEQGLQLKTNKEGPTYGVGHGLAHLLKHGEEFTDYGGIASVLAGETKDFPKLASLNSRGMKFDIYQLETSDRGEDIFAVSIADPKGNLITTYTVKGGAAIDSGRKALINSIEDILKNGDATYYAPANPKEADQDGIQTRYVELIKGELFAVYERQGNSLYVRIQRAQDHPEILENISGKYKASDYKAFSALKKDVVSQNVNLLDLIPAAQQTPFQKVLKSIYDKAFRDYPIEYGLKQRLKLQTKGYRRFTADKDLIRLLKLFNDYLDGLVSEGKITADQEEKLLRGAMLNDIGKKDFVALQVQISQDFRSSGANQEPQPNSELVLNAPLYETSDETVLVPINAPRINEQGKTSGKARFSVGAGNVLLHDKKPVFFKGRPVMADFVSDQKQAAAFDVDGVSVPLQTRDGRFVRFSVETNLTQESKKITGVKLGKDVVSRANLAATDKKMLDRLNALVLEDGSEIKIDRKAMNIKDAGAYLANLPESQTISNNDLGVPQSAIVTDNSGKSVYTFSDQSKEAIKIDFNLGSIKGSKIDERLEKLDNLSKAAGKTESAETRAIVGSQKAFMDMIKIFEQPETSKGDRNAQDTAYKNALKLSQDFNVPFDVLLNFAIFKMSTGGGFTEKGEEIAEIAEEKQLQQLGTLRDEILKYHEEKLAAEKARVTPLLTPQEIISLGFKGSQIGKIRGDLIAAQKAGTVTDKLSAENFVRARLSSAEVRAASLGTVTIEQLQNAANFGLEVKMDSAVETRLLDAIEKSENLEPGVLKRTKEERRGTGYHLTIIPPTESKVMKENAEGVLDAVNNQLLPKLTESGSISIAGIGMRQSEKGDKKTYFLVIDTAKSPSLDEFRKTLGLGEYDLHITLGFVGNDVFPGKKDPKSGFKIVTPELNNSLKDLVPTSVQLGALEFPPREAVRAASMGAIPAAEKRQFVITQDQLDHIQRHISGKQAGSHFTTDRVGNQSLLDYAKTKLMEKFQADDFSGGVIKLEIDTGENIGKNSLHTITEEDMAQGKIVRHLRDRGKPNEWEVNVFSGSLEDTSMMSIIAGDIRISQLLTAAGHKDDLPFPTVMSLAGVFFPKDVDVTIQDREKVDQAIKTLTEAGKLKDKKGNNLTPEDLKNIADKYYDQDFVKNQEMVFGFYTTFPGPLGEPPPSRARTPEEKARAEKFWNTHAFIMEPLDKAVEELIARGIVDLERFQLYRNLTEPAEGEEEEEFGFQTIHPLSQTFGHQMIGEILHGNEFDTVNIAGRQQIEDALKARLEKMPESEKAALRAKAKAEKEAKEAADKLREAARRQSFVNQTEAALAGMRVDQKILLVEKAVRETYPVYELPLTAAFYMDEALFEAMVMELIGLEKPYQTIEEYKNSLVPNGAGTFTGTKIDQIVKKYTLDKGVKPRFQSPEDQVQAVQTTLVAVLRILRAVAVAPPVSLLKPNEKQAVAALKALGVSKEQFGLYQDFVDRKIIIDDMDFDRLDEVMLVGGAVNRSKIDFHDKESMNRIGAELSARASMSVPTAITPNEKRAAEALKAAGVSREQLGFYLDFLNKKVDLDGISSKQEQQLMLVGRTLSFSEVNTRDAESMKRISAELPSTGASLGAVPAELRRAFENISAREGGLTEESQLIIFDTLLSKGITLKGFQLYLRFKQEPGFKFTQANYEEHGSTPEFLMEDIEKILEGDRDVNRYEKALVKYDELLSKAPEMGKAQIKPEEEIYSEDSFEIIRELENGNARYANDKNFKVFLGHFGTIKSQRSAYSPQWYTNEEAKWNDAVLLFEQMNKNVFTEANLAAAIDAYSKHADEHNNYAFAPIYAFLRVNRAAFTKQILINLVRDNRWMSRDVLYAYDPKLSREDIPGVKNINVVRLLGLFPDPEMQKELFQLLDAKFRFIHRSFGINAEDAAVLKAALPLVPVVSADSKWENRVRALNFLEVYLHKEAASSELNGLKDYFPFVQAKGAALQDVWDKYDSFDKNPNQRAFIEKNVVIGDEKAVSDQIYEGMYEQEDFFNRNVFWFLVQFRAMKNEDIKLDILAQLMKIALEYAKDNENEIRAFHSFLDRVEKTDPAMKPAAAKMKQDLEDKFKYLQATGWRGTLNKIKRYFTGSGKVVIKPSAIVKAKTQVANAVTGKEALPVGKEGFIDFTATGPEDLGAAKGIEKGVKGPISAQSLGAIQTISLPELRKIAIGAGAVKANYALEEKRIFDQQIAALKEPERKLMLAITLYQTGKIKDPKVLARFLQSPVTLKQLQAPLGVEVFKTYSKIKDGDRRNIRGLILQNMTIPTSFRTYNNAALTLRPKVTDAVANANFLQLLNSGANMKVFYDTKAGKSYVISRERGNDLTQPTRFALVDGENPKRRVVFYTSDGNYQNEVALAFLANKLSNQKGAISNLGKWAGSIVGVKAASLGAANPFETSLETPEADARKAYFDAVRAKVNAYFDQIAAPEKLNDVAVQIAGLSEISSDSVLPILQKAGLPFQGVLSQLVQELSTIRESAKAKMEVPAAQATVGRVGLQSMLLDIAGPTPPADFQQLESSALQQVFTPEKLAALQAIRSEADAVRAEAGIEKKSSIDQYDQKSFDLRSRNLKMLLEEIKSIGPEGKVVVHLTADYLDDLKKIQDDLIKLNGGDKSIISKIKKVEHTEILEGDVTAFARKMIRFGSGIIVMIPENAAVMKGIQTGNKFSVDGAALKKMKEAEEFFNEFIETLRAIPPGKEGDALRQKLETEFADLGIRRVDGAFTVDLTVLFKRVADEFKAVMKARVAA